MHGPGPEEESRCSSALGRIGGGVLLAAATLGVVIVATPGTALAAQGNGNVTCTGSIVSTTITGNVTLPAGDLCVLVSDTVEGNVSVGEGAGFEAGATMMRRNLSTEGAYAVVLEFDTVDGNSSFDATSGAVDLCGGEVGVCEGFAYNLGTPTRTATGRRTSSAT